jgi:hypothetical protein
MAQSYKRSLLVALVALAPAFTACERVDSISGVTESPAPVVTTQAKPKYTQLIARSSSGTVPTQVAWEYISPKRKGRLQIGAYVLNIPRGAVKDPTWFRMVVVDNGFISVELDAWSKQGRVTQFQLPLKLTVPYADASPEQVEDPAKLLLAHTVDTEILEVIGATVDPLSRTVTGVIWHFSTWTLAKEISMGID